MPVIQEGIYITHFKHGQSVISSKRHFLCWLEYIPVSGIKESNYPSKVQPLHNLMSKWYITHPTSIVQNSTKRDWNQFWHPCPTDSYPPVNQHRYGTSMKSVGFPKTVHISVGVFICQSWGIQNDIKMKFTTVLKIINQKRELWTKNNLKNRGKKWKKKHFTDKNYNDWAWLICCNINSNHPQ